MDVIRPVNIAESDRPGSNCRPSPPWDQLLPGFLCNASMIEATFSARLRASSRVAYSLSWNAILCNATMIEAMFNARLRASTDVAHLQISMTAACWWMFSSCTRSP